jgi:hypothetical protein
LSGNAKAFHFVAIILKSLALSLCLSFFTIYAGFAVEIGGLGRGSGVFSQALAETFFFSLLTNLAVSAFFR